MKIYKIQTLNKFPPLVLADKNQWAGLDSKIGYSRFGLSWKPLEFEFDRTEQELTVIPDISVAYISSILVVRTAVRDIVLSGDSRDLELLPILVEGDSWTLVNCLS